MEPSSSPAPIGTPNSQTLLLIFGFLFFWMFSYSGSGYVVLCVSYDFLTEIQVPFIMHIYIPTVLKFMSKDWYPSAGTRTFFLFGMKENRKDRKYGYSYEIPTLHHIIISKQHVLVQQHNNRTAAQQAAKKKAEILRSPPSILFRVPYLWYLSRC